MHEWVCCGDEAANHQLPIAADFWIIWIVSLEERSSLTQILMQICCSTQSFWMWRPHSAHTPSIVSTTPLTSTVKSSLFTHTHSSPLSLAARLHRCCTNHSCYINNGWTFSGQTSNNGILCSNKNKILPFVTTSMDWEGRVLSEVSQRQTNSIWFHSLVECKTKADS